MDTHRLIIPDISKLPDTAVYRLSGCSIYYVKEVIQNVAEPALTLCVYHDASQVEVLTGHLKHGLQQYNYKP